MALEIGIGTTRYTKVLATDDPDIRTGASHNYEVQDAEGGFIRCEINFQDGPVGSEGSTEGVFMEDLLAIVVHRLQGFQSGMFACRDNALALTKIQEATFWLKHRTDEREARGVLNTLKK